MHRLSRFVSLRLRLISSLLLSDLNPLSGEMEEMSRAHLIDIVV